MGCGLGILDPERRSGSPGLGHDDGHEQCEKGKAKHGSKQGRGGSSANSAANSSARGVERRGRGLSAARSAFFVELLGVRQLHRSRNQIDVPAAPTDAHRAGFLGG